MPRSGAFQNLLKPARALVVQKTLLTFPGTRRLSNDYYPTAPSFVGCRFQQTRRVDSPQATFHHCVDQWDKGSSACPIELRGPNCVYQKTPLDWLQLVSDFRKPRDIEWLVSTSQHQHFLWLEFANRAVRNGNLSHIQRAIKRPGRNHNLTLHNASSHPPKGY